MVTTYFVVKSEQFGICKVGQGEVVLHKKLDKLKLVLSDGQRHETFLIELE